MPNLNLICDITFFQSPSKSFQDRVAGLASILSKTLIKRRMFLSLAFYRTKIQSHSD